MLEAGYTVMQVALYRHLCQVSWHIAGMLSSSRVCKTQVLVTRSGPRGMHILCTLLLQMCR